MVLGALLTWSKRWTPYIRCYNEGWVQKMIEAEDGHAKVEKHDGFAHEGNGAERLLGRDYGGVSEKEEGGAGSSAEILGRAKRQHIFGPYHHQPCVDGERL